MEGEATQAQKFSWRNVSHLSILVVGFALAFDFSVVAISIQVRFQVAVCTQENKVGQPCEAARDGPELA
jgi:hypothetical protein